VATDAAGLHETVTSAPATYAVEGAATVTVSAPDVTWANESSTGAGTGTVTLSGTTTNAVSGSAVTVTLGDGHTYTGTVGADGTYSISANAADLVANQGHTLTATLVATDAAGLHETVTSAPATYAVEGAATVTVSVPDITNANENGTISISGVTTGAVAGSPVTVNLADGVSYNGTVNSDGTFTISNVPATAMVANQSHTLTATLVATDAAGLHETVTSAPATYHVDIPPPVAITVTVADGNDVTWTDQGIKTHGDDGGEDGSGNSSLPVHGQVTGAFTAGDTVTVAVGGSSYTTTVDSSGNYSVNVAESVLATHSSVTATIAAHDSSGTLQTVGATQAYTVDTTPTISVNVGSGNELTWSEQGGSSVSVTGHVSGTFTSGDTVTLKVGDGQQYSGTVDASGNYSISVDESVLANHSSVTATLTATDSANASITVSTNQSYTVDDATTIKVNDINYGNNSDSTANVEGHVNGTFTPGDAVTVTVGSTQVVGTVDSHGNFSVGVDKSLLGSNGTVTATISAHDAAGEVTTATDSKAYGNQGQGNNQSSGNDNNENDGQQQNSGNSGSAGDGNNTDGNGASTNSASISIDKIGSGSGVIDIGQESTNGNVAVTGTVSGTFHAGDTVTLTAGNATVGSGTVDGSGHYSINVAVSALEGATSIGASVAATDGQGNSTNATTSQSYSVEAMPQITIDGLNSSYVVNISEENGSANINVTGTVTGTYQQGDVVTLTVGSQTFTGTVNGNGGYNIGVPVSVLEGSTSISASVQAHDSQNNNATATASHDYSVEPLPQITVNPIGDLNISEENAQTSIAVTGHVTGTFSVNDPVTLSVGDHTYSGSVDASGNYSINVPGNVLADNHSMTASIVATDSQGHTATADPGSQYTVEALPQIAINAVGAGNEITAADQTNHASVTVTGAVTGTFEAGDVVTLTVGASTFTGAVAADGSFNIAVSSDVLSGATSVSASVTAHDAAGNSTTASTSQSYIVDSVPTAPPVTTDSTVHTDGTPPVTTPTGDSGTTSAGSSSTTGSSGTTTTDASSTSSGTTGSTDTTTSSTSGTTPPVTGDTSHGSQAGSSTTGSSGTTTTDASSTSSGTTGSTDTTTSSTSGTTTTVTGDTSHGSQAGSSTTGSSGTTTTDASSTSSGTTGSTDTTTSSTSGTTPPVTGDTSHGSQAGSSSSGSSGTTPPVTGDTSHGSHGSSSVATDTSGASGGTSGSTDSTASSTSGNAGVSSSSGTLNVNDVLSTNSGDLLQHLPSTPPGGSTTDTTTTTAPTTPPLTDTSVSTGTTMPIDAEALKALVNAVTPPPASHGSH
jgi:hypothetical protein